MGSFSEEEEECRFFDAQEDVVSTVDGNSVDGDDNGVSIGFDYEVWTRSPRSVRERRVKFMKRMGLGNSVDLCSVEWEEEGVMDRVEDSSGAVTSTFGLEEEFCSTQASVSRWPHVNSSEGFGLEENLPCQDGNLVRGVGFNVNKEGKEHRKISGGRDLGSDQLVAVAEEQEDSEDASGSAVSPSQHREFEKMDADAVSRRTNSGRRGWLRRLQSITCMIDRQREGDDNGREGRCAISGCRLQKVKVRQHKKQMKELSSLDMRQDIQAHEGAILTMKFSPDGQYLASGGEDGVVRLWQVVEEDRCNEVDIPEIDPSCIYFTVNNLSELTPLFMDKEKVSKLKNMKKTSDSACIVFPPKIFRLSDKPLHEFRGHRSEVLDLSWSKNNVGECH